MLTKNNKTQYHKPTVDEFLKYRPKQQDFEWSTNKEGLVRIKVPKFKRNFGKTFCRIIHKNDSFTANLDELGSIVWKCCNGKNTVKKILEKIKKEFPKEDNIDQRLFLFIQQMSGLNYIDF